MKRVAFKMKLKAGCREEYERRHALIWPELATLLSENGITEYSIFYDEDTDVLFAFQKQGGEQSSQDLATNEIVRRWWRYMADIMETNPDSSPVSIPLPEVFYMN